MDAISSRNGSGMAELSVKPDVSSLTTSSAADALAAVDTSRPVNSSYNSPAIRNSCAWAESDAAIIPVAMPCNTAVFKAVDSLSLSISCSHETDTDDFSSASDMTETVSASCNETDPANKNKVGPSINPADNDRYFLSGRVFNHRISNSGRSFASRSNGSLLTCSGCSGFSNHRSNEPVSPARMAEAPVCGALASSVPSADCPFVFPAACSPVPSSDSCSSIS